MKGEQGHTLEEDSRSFALRIVKMCAYLNEKKHEFVLSKQALRSGTSIGANIAEAAFAQSRLDFVNKMHVALKEASETIYWLTLLNDAKYISQTQFNSIIVPAQSLLARLVASVKTAKSNLRKESRV